MDGYDRAILWLIRINLLMATLVTGWEGAGFFMDVDVSLPLLAAGSLTVVLQSVVLALFSWGHREERKPETEDAPVD